MRLRPRELGPQKVRFLMAVLVGVLAITSLAAAVHARSLSRQAQLATADATACLQLASQIRGLRQRPRKIESQQVQQPQLAKRIETAGTLAGIPLSAFSRIDPESPRRLGDTAYEEMPTQLSLRSVNLRQLVSLLYNLSTDDLNLNVKQIRLSAPRGTEAQDLWNAEVTLTYLIYAPKAGDRRLETGA
jgi:hypothetical protein